MRTPFLDLCLGAIPEIAREMRRCDVVHFFHECKLADRCQQILVLCHNVCFLGIKRMFV